MTERDASVSDMRHGPASPEAGPKGLVWRIVDAVVLFSVGGMVVTVALQVVSRAFGASIPWTEELTRYLFVYTIFLGLAAGFRNAGHARVAVLVTKLPRRVQQVTVHLYAFSTITFFLIVGVKAWELTLQQIESQERSPSLGWGMYWMTLPMVASAALTILGVVQTVYRVPELRRSLERGEMTAL